MSHTTSSRILLAVGLMALAAWLVWFVVDGRRFSPLPKATPLADETGLKASESLFADEKFNQSAVGDSTVSESQRRATTSLLREGLERRLKQRRTRPGEAVLTFKSFDAFHKFLGRSTQAGMTVRGKIDGLRAVRVAYSSVDSIVDDMVLNPGDYQGVDANFLVQVPESPTPENRPQVSQVAVGNRALALIGASGDRSQWGRGVTVAVLDTGVALDPTVGGGRVQFIDVGWGILPGNGAEDGHGTAVAALVGGALLDAPGVAPAATLLSLRVTDADGVSDSFTLAQAIVAAVEAGSRVINISMGAYGTSRVLTSSIDFAIARDAVIVASAGNDGAAQLNWPAADPRVISVGAVDALEQQVYFSNSGAQLKMVAPGYGIDTAWLDGQRVSFDGTSASAPLVSGAIAAMMSTNPGLSAAQAWALLVRYASDGGVPGSDPDYGHGMLNLGWAMHRSDMMYADPAIAGEYYDPISGTMNVVVQNRGMQAVSGLQLNLNVSGRAQNYLIPALNSGETYRVQTSVEPEQLVATNGIVFRSQLTNPGGIVDWVPENNVKAGVIIPPVK